MELFESGAIVLHLADKSAALAPQDAAGRARVTMWVIASLNSVEPFVQNLVQLDVFYAGEPWTKEFRPKAEAMLEKRLTSLAGWLDGKEYLEGRFTAGDLMMSDVLRVLQNTGVLGRFPALDAYRLRCTSRPAFARAMEAQMQAFGEHAAA
jgi:glutathione S-transferase